LSPIAQGFSPFSSVSDFELHGFDSRRPALDFFGHEGVWRRQIQGFGA
jgi:hypothetical protein